MRTSNNRAAVTAGTNPAVATDGQHRGTRRPRPSRIALLGDSVSTSRRTGTDCSWRTAEQAQPQKRTTEAETSDAVRSDTETETEAQPRQSRGEAPLPLASNAAKTHMISPMNTGDARFTASEIASSRNATTRLNRPPCYRERWAAIQTRTMMLAERRQQRRRQRSRSVSPPPASR
jgi:hypothetical protein